MKEGGRERGEGRKGVVYKRGGMKALRGEGRKGERKEGRECEGKDFESIKEEEEEEEEKKKKKIQKNLCDGRGKRGA